MRGFDHEKLDAYRAGLEFVALADGIVRQRMRGRRHLADQLHRAATSICLNIAEGAGEYSGADKARFYRMARRSATECAAILDILVRIGAIPAAAVTTGRETLLRLVAMLTALARRTCGSGRARS